MVARAMSFALLVVLLVLLAVDGRNLVLEHLDPRAKSWIAARLGADEITVGTIEFSLGAGEDPAGLVLRDLEISQGDTGPSLSLPRLETDFQVLAGLQGQVRPSTLELGGLALRLKRSTDGGLLLGAGGADAPMLALLKPGGAAAATPNFGAILQATEALDRMDMLSALKTVDIIGVDLDFSDEGTGRVLSAKDATAYLRREGDALSAGLTARLTEPGARTDLTLQASLQRAPDSRQTRYAVRFQNARPSDIADQVGVLTWLSLIDAPVDGALTAEFAADGALLGLSGTLSMGAGYVRPLPERVVPFTSASVRFAYDAARDRFEISTFQLDTIHGKLQAAGPLLLERDATGDIAALVGQLELSSVTLAADSVFADSIDFATGQAIGRITFDPFRLEIGTLSLRNGDLRATVTGAVEARPTHWQVALNAALEELPVDRVLALWPEAFKPKLRGWLAEHIEDGRLTHFTTHLRRTEGGKTSAIDFAFEEGRAQLFRDMPPIVNASGSGQLVDGRFDLVLDTGHTAPRPGASDAEGIDLAGSRMVIEDTRQKPALSDVALKGRGNIPDMLALIDMPPLNLLQRVRMPADFATGTAEVAADLQFLMHRQLKPRDVAAEVTATLHDVEAPRMIPGRSMTAETLSLSASNAGLRIEGPVMVAGVPVDASYTRDFGPEAGPPTVTGRLPVTVANAAALGIALPGDLIEGQGDGTFRLSLHPDAPADFDATVRLSGTGLTIPALNWRKSPAAAGTLRVTGQLGAPVRIDRLQLDGPGLALSGAIGFDGGKLTGAKLDRLALGRWLDAPVTFRQGADGRAKVSVNGGRIDLRGGTPTLGQGRAALDLTLAPDEVIVSDAIRLRGVRGSLSSGARPLGRFDATLNGATPITGVVRSGGEVFLQADDGGAALRAAGIFRNALGGTLRVALKATQGGGPINGAFSLQNTRVVSATTLSEILRRADAGRLASQIDEAGLGFDDAQGRFSIDKGQILLSEARAVGSSLGVTLAGRYDLASRALNMEGVVSPLYAVNGLFERLPVVGRLLGGRPGEGLLGATFTVTGSGKTPQVAVNPLSLLTPGATREIFETRAGIVPGG
ncbi:AsmA-like C-terminal region-containing protein [Oceanibium sediminis]|uniref:AsmA-like C-terminal region-containing protein n=1 Tax=Oceanibium sediminis TaxID=2026339 RepID=UPI0013002092|nr:AsmA-like C-terminal region-containing protein [Oceanibium sediminis]